MEALRHHRDAQRLERAFAADAYVDQDLVFADELGGAIHAQRLTQWFRKHRKAAGIPTGSLHPQAHSRDSGADQRRPRSYRRCSARGTPQTVLGTYAHLLPQSDEIAAERVAAALAGA